MLFLPMVYTHTLWTQTIFIPVFAIAFLYADRNHSGLSFLDLAVPMFLLGSITYLAMNSKFGYELAIRENFVRNAALRVARDQAQAADRAKSEFLATISHELRTPLNAILGNIRLICKERQLNHHQASMLRDAETSAATMEKLVNDVLEISSLDVGDASAKETRFLLSDILQDLNATLGVLASEKSLTFELPADPLHGRPVFGDEGRIRQILLNLLGNAIKFTRTGKVGLRLTFRRGRLVFLVYDTGIGIPDDQQVRVFEAFFRASNIGAGEFRGTGLGLTIVHRMITNLGGSIRIRSTPENGTFVRGEVPLRLATTVPTNAPKKISIADLDPLKILVVEDEPMNMAVISQYLHLGRNDVVKTTTMAEALTAYAHADFDCVLSDIRLPDRSGVDLPMELTRLASEKCVPDVPIFALTANVLDRDLQSYEDAGFDGVVAKPIDEHALANALHLAAMQKKFNAVSMHRISAETSAISSAQSLPQDLVALYIRSLEECAEGLEESVDRNDLSRIAHYAHRIAGAAALRGDAELSEGAMALERILKDENFLCPSRLQALRSHLEVAMARAGSDLRQI